MSNVGEIVAYSATGSIILFSLISMLYVFITRWCAKRKKAKLIEAEKRKQFLRRTRSKEKLRKSIAMSGKADPNLWEQSHIPTSPSSYQQQQQTTDYYNVQQAPVYPYPSSQSGYLLQQDVSLGYNNYSQQPQQMARPTIPRPPGLSFT